MAQKVKDYLSLIKFSHTIFALPFAIIGFVLGAVEYQKLSALNALQQVGANSPLKWQDKEYGLVFLFALVLGCMIFARSAAMAFNRYLDRNIDIKNPRTAVREIPAGVISAKNALAFTIISCLLFITCTFFINRICFYLSPVALFVILFYSYTKRFTALCHLVLGLGLSLAPIGAYLAVIGSFAVLPILFSVVVLCWVSGFDIIYALQDEEFDASQKLHSIPVMLGKKRALGLSTLLHIIAAFCIVSIGVLSDFGLWYWCGALVFMGMLYYQHSIVSPTDLRRVNVAFMTANGIASVVFAAFVLMEIFF